MTLLVQKRGPDFGYHLNLGKSFYLMSPPDGRSPNEPPVQDKIDLLVRMGVNIDNIRLHPDCALSGNLSGMPLTLQLFYPL